MNKTYRSVWSETDQTWVAAPETSSAGRKTARRLVLLAGSALGIAASLSSNTGWAATGTVGQGGLELCTGAKGYAWGSSGSNEALDCSADGKGTSDGMAFALNNAGDTKGGYGFAASTAQVAGYQNGTLKIKGASVMVYGPTTFDSVVTMSNQKIVQLAPGKVSADSTEAVNGSQLYAVSTGVANAVQYDSAAHNAVTLGGAQAGKPVALHNVAAGALSSASTDAVNGAQLYNAIQQFDGSVTHYVGVNGDPGEGNYNGEGASGTGAIAIGAAASAAGTGAVAMGSASQATGDHALALGNYASAQGANATAIGAKSLAEGDKALALGAGAMATQSNAVALGAGSATEAATGTSGATIRDTYYEFAGTNPTSTVSVGSAGNERTITNVAAGRLSSNSTDAVNGSQLYATNQAIDGIVMQSGNFVAYDNVDKTQVTFGGAGSTTPVRLANVANGVAATDAVNLAQLQSSNPYFNAQGPGAPAVATAPGAVAIGANSVATDPNVVSVGATGATRRIVNVAAGYSDTDAVNYGQLQSLTNDAQTAIDTLSGDIDAVNTQLSAFGAIVNTDPTRQSLTVGLNAASTGTSSVALGTSALSSGNAGTALGAQAVASAVNSVALGSASVANQDNTVSVGSDGTTTRTLTNPDGSTTTVQSQANTRRIVNLAAGQGDTDAVNVSQMRSVASALGGGAGINAAGGFIAPSYSVGGTTVNTVGDAITNLDDRILKNTTDIASVNAELNNVASVASAPASTPTRMVAATRTMLGAGSVGDAATTTDADALHYDSADHSSVTLSSTSGANVSLSGLQNGALSANSTDAVTGQQLYATNQQVASINQAVQNISMTGSTAVSANTTSGVAAASGTQAVAVGGGAVATGANSTAIGDKANASANNAVAIGANSIANRDNAVSVGQEGAERQVVNVAAGTSGTDAVNLNQLNNAMTQQSKAFGQQISNLQGSINTVSKNAYAGVAAAMAMPNLTPSGPGRTVVAAGGGYYMGGSAAAVGVTYRSTNMHWLINGAASVTSTGNAAVRTQVGYEF